MFTCRSFKRSLLVSAKNVPACGWCQYGGCGDVAEVFKNVYDHECHVSKLIDELVDVASAEKDKATQDFLWGFVREQVEEEATARDLAEKFAKAGEAGILFLDSQLAQRK